MKKKIHKIQTGYSDFFKDISYRAKSPGRRKSKSGKYYYEYRTNRSDMNPSQHL